MFILINISSTARIYVVNIYVLKKAYWKKESTSRQTAHSASNVYRHSNEANA